MHIGPFSPQVPWYLCHAFVSCGGYREQILINSDTWGYTYQGVSRWLCTRGVRTFRKFAIDFMPQTRSSEIIAFLCDRRKPCRINNGPPYLDLHTADFEGATFTEWPFFYWNIKLNPGQSYRLYFAHVSSLHFLLLIAAVKVISDFKSTVVTILVYFQSSIPFECVVKEIFGLWIFYFCFEKHNPIEQLLDSAHCENWKILKLFRRK